MAHEICLASGLDVRKGTIYDISDEAEFFDTVCAFQVLEHVYDVKGFLNAALRLLKKGGKLMIGVPNNEPFIRRYEKYNAFNLPPHHVGLWNKAAFERLCPFFGIKLKEYEYDEEINRWVVDAYLRARLWMDVRSEIHHHSLGDYMKLIVAAPFSLPISFWDYKINGINGSYIVALFEKD